jgi:hypothetical protein
LALLVEEDVHNKAKLLAEMDYNFQWLTCHVTTARQAKTKASVPLVVACAVSMTTLFEIHRYTIKGLCEL